MDLHGRVAVVTGAARRLGAAIALGLADAGCHVVVNYRHSAADAEHTAAAARRAGVSAFTVQGDVSRAADVSRLLDTTVSRLGTVDLLVACAGAFRRTPVDTLTEADWDDMLDNNLRTCFLCTHRFGLYMRDHGGGALIALADVAGMRPWAEHLPYSVAKAGVIALTQGLAKAFAPTVRVNAIAPGPVLFPEGYDPALRERELARTLLRREGTAQPITDAVLALARNDYITGVILPVDGGRLLT